MGTSLFNTTPSATYPALIKVTDNTTLSTALKTLSDGSGNDSALQLSTRRIGVLSDSSVTTQTSSVIQATTTNANLVIAPNGTGALVASIPDGTTAGGNARGVNAVDLQMSRSSAAAVSVGNFSSLVGGSGNQALGAYSIAGGQLNSAVGSHSVCFGNTNSAGGQSTAVFGQSNSASTNFSTVSGGQSNTASTNSHATVVGGFSNTASGQYSIAGGQTITSSGSNSVGFGRNNTASGTRSVALGGEGAVASGTESFAFGGSVSALAQNSVVMGFDHIGNSTRSFAVGGGASTYLTGQFSLSQGKWGVGGAANGNAQQSLLTAKKEDTLNSAATTVLSLDGTGTTNLIIPNGTNRMWKVKVEYVGTITTITGTATGLTVGDSVYGEENFGFKKLSGTSTMGPIMNETQSSDNAIMDTCALAVTAGASQEMALTFTGPTFAGGGSVTMRVVAKVALVEVAF